MFPVVDLIRRSTAAYLLKCRFPCETGRSQAPRRQQGCTAPPHAASPPRAQSRGPHDGQQPRAICCTVVGRPCAILGAAVARMMWPARNLLPRDMLAAAAAVRRCFRRCFRQRCDG
ncbi:hypothetical protein F511_45962 [Dorcoceras hygrometricum]|uniref:Uncharacterized protein n=1 Tax=Dorcoceras hygrometricum TaxID=472368 RepID=A0A2Z7A1R1_9LAMI|nr:hypothetical protein F511_45962 [Dorcoceras hygrometricum]